MPHKLSLTNGLCKAARAILLAALSVAAFAANSAEWSAEKQAFITDYMHRYRRDWTLADTQQMAQGTVPHTEATVFIEGRPINSRLMADDGRPISVEVFGQSILIDGKDLSGNLGSKTTSGTNSPIIENVTGSQIATGPGSSIVKDTSSTVSVNISLSIALSVSVVLNLYLLRELRRLPKDSIRSSRKK